ncbi:hypothetical protein [Sphingomonas mollis]|uniref:Integral membrane protein n=1 Tax=Sphingomonas mollis TaxID=2795726 RepID=A0ABS0XTE4_9SPHN|nr:hypothetical protein [Sphingomonas sp. BT553]MBJ6123306.1 hypothetical protein [Sphingomonas sp. BT553]
MNTNRTMDVAALAALVWIAAATLHEGLGHGVACRLMGGDPIGWSTFHFNCDHRSVSLPGWRTIAGAGTAVNVVLMVFGYLWWRRGIDPMARLAAWTVVAVNGLTTFGYLVFSAAFGIGDWNTAGVIAGVSNTGLARAMLAIIGIAGYVAVIRLSGTMLSRMLQGPTATADARRITTTIWLTTGIVSLLAGLMAGADWRSTLGAALGVALGGNAGLLTIPRFTTSSNEPGTFAPRKSVALRVVAVLSVAAFVSILGPGVRL